MAEAIRVDILERGLWQELELERHEGSEARGLVQAGVGMRQVRLLEQALEAQVLPMQLGGRHSS